MAREPVSMNGILAASNRFDTSLSMSNSLGIWLIRGRECRRCSISIGQRPVEFRAPGGWVGVRFRSRHVALPEVRAWGVPSRLDPVIELAPGGTEALIGPV